MAFVSKVLRFCAGFVLGLSICAAFADETIKETHTFSFDNSPNKVIVYVPSKWRSANDSKMSECDLKLIDATKKKRCRIFVDSADLLKACSLQKIVEKYESFVFSKTLLYVAPIEQNEKFVLRLLRSANTPSDTYLASWAFTLGDYLITVILKERASSEQQFADDCEVLLNHIFLVDKGL